MHVCAPTTLREVSNMVAERGCSATASAAWKPPRLLRKKLGEDVLNASQMLVALAETRQASDRDDSGMCRTGVKARKTDRGMLNEWIDNAQAQLNNTCYAVSNAAHCFVLLRRSLEKKSMQDDRATIKMNSSKFAHPWKSRDLILRTRCAQKQPDVRGCRQEQ